MSRMISAQSHNSTIPVEAGVLARVLSEIGIPEAAGGLDQLNLSSDEEVLFRLKRNCGSDRRLASSIAALQRRGISLFTQWPPGTELCESGGVFVVLGNATCPSFTTAVSSRLGRTLDKHPEWFDALRTFCLQLNHETCLLIAPGQFTYRFLRRLAALYAIRVAVMLQTTIEQFGKGLSEATLLQQAESGSESTCVLRVVASDDQLLPGDRCVAAFCREIRSIHLRPNGNIHHLLTQRLSTAAAETSCRTMILTPNSPQRPKYVESLLQQGAIAWHVVGPPADPSFRFSANDAVCQGSFTKILRLDQIDPEKYVSHFTRRQRGAWLDESEANYLDSLLLGHANRHRGALATLQRIVVQQQLIADNRLTRDASRVVCFTNRPLREFRRLRFFRNHLARWDFEPYGVAIDRAVLTSLGGRPVVYGDESDWERMDSAHRPFFQRADGVSANWTIEAEWRVVGDLNLTHLRADEAMVFVASDADARNLAPYCRWPIVVLND